MRIINGLVSLAAMTLAGCGGASSGGAQSSSAIAVVPAPPAAPTPAPTPTPSATQSQLATQAVTPASVVSVWPFVPTPAAKPRIGIALPLGKCINMADHLEAPTEGDWGRPIAEDDFQIIKTAGFATVRIPVKFSGHMNASRDTIDPIFMARVQHVVDLASNAGLNVIIDLHNFEELSTDPAGNALRFAGLWRQIAREFASAPSSVWFELLNEPNGNLNAANLPALMASALAEVRKTNPTRPVIIPGEDFSAYWSLKTLKLPNDPNVVPTIHYYGPFAFTHQGANWLSPTPPIDVQFGTASDYAQITDMLNTVKTFMADTGRVPFIGEYGANDAEGVPVADRILYYGTVSAALSSIGVQGCAWGYTNTFRLRDGDHWYPGMVGAISTTTTLL